MEENILRKFDILLYPLGIVLTFTFLFISNQLAEPLITELKTGTPFLDLMFNSEDNIEFPLNLFLPFLLLCLGIIILLFLLWNLTKGIFLNDDTLTIKILMVILILILSSVLIKVLITLWSLLKIALIWIFISLLILGVFVSFLNHSSEK